MRPPQDGIPFNWRGIRRESINGRAKVRLVLSEGRYSEPRDPSGSRPRNANGTFAPVHDSLLDGQGRGAR